MRFLIYKTKKAIFEVVFAFSIVICMFFGFIKEIKP